MTKIAEEVELQEINRSDTGGLLKSHTNTSVKGTRQGTTVALTLGKGFGDGGTVAKGTGQEVNNN